MNKKRISILICIMFIISSIPGMNVTIPALAAADETITVYDMDKDSSLKAGGEFNSPFLTKSGGVNISVIEGEDGTVSLDLADRANSWDALDILREQLQVDGKLVKGTYNFTVKGHVAEGTPADTNMVFSMNGAPYTWFKNVNPAADGTFTLEYQTTDDLSALEYNYRVQTGGNDGVHFYIDSIVITVAPIDETVTIYDMDKDSSLKAGEAFNSSFLTKSGGVNISVIEGEDGTVSLDLADRANSWDALDIERDQLQVDGKLIKGTYSFTVKGHVAEGTPADTNMVFTMNGAPYTWFKNVSPAADGTFTLEYQTTDDLSALEYNYRVQTGGDDGVHFYVDSIVITVVPSGDVEEEEETVDGIMTLYDLDETTLKVGDEIGSTPSSFLTKSGDGNVVAVKGADGTISLDLKDRKNNWDGVDISRDVLKKNDVFLAGKYTFTVKGHLAPGTETDASLVLGMTEAPWSELKKVNAAADGTFIIEYVKEYTASELSMLGYSYRIQTNPAGAGVHFYVDNIVITVEGKGGAPTVTEIQSYTFDDKAAQEKLFTVAGSSKIEWAKGVGLGKDSDTALKVSHIDGKSYTGADNAVRLKLSEPLEGGGVYKVSAWFFVPEKGNEDKAALTGTGIVLDGDYAGATGESKFPAAPGTMPVGEWKELSVTLPMAKAPISTIDFRYVVNDEPNHPDVWYLDNITISQIGDVEKIVIPEWDLNLESLAEAYKNYFLLGNILEPHELDNADTTAMFKHQYNVITAENAMKPIQMARTKGVYSFDSADKLVAWASANGIQVHGHTLVWHSQSAPWVNTGEDGKALTRAEAKANMQDFINAVAGHYKGQLLSWDVVNEAFLSGVSDVPADWRDALRKFDGGSEASMWYQAYENGADKSKGEDGSDYIYDAFVFTRLADPTAILYYNDFNETMEGKREAIAMMVEELNAQWKKDSRNKQPERLLIEGIGMQAHYWTFDLKASDVEASILRFIETGAEITVSEVDIPHGWWNNYKERTTEPTEEEEALQADFYRQVFEVYKKYSNYIARVTLWGKADPQSWRSEGYPSLFDKYFDTKDAYWTVMDVAADKKIVPVTVGDNKGKDKEKPGSSEIAKGSLVEIKAGTTNYYKGGAKIPAWVINNYNYVVTQTTYGGKTVKKGGEVCVLLGKKVKKSGGKEEVGINTWVAVSALNVVDTKATTPSQNNDSSETYTVKKGDSLWSIAAAKLGSGFRYKEIKTLNGLKNDILSVNQKIKLPKK